MAAAASASNSKPITLKLLIHKKEQRVLFAEADKKTVDFLIHILTLPMGTLISLLKEQKMEMVSCLANVYESVQSLSKTKDILLNKDILDDAAPLFPLPVPDSPSIQTDRNKVGNVSYTCQERWATFICGDEPGSKYEDDDRSAVYCSDEPGTLCPFCSKAMSMKMPHVRHGGVSPTTPAKKKQRTDNNNKAAGEDVQEGGVGFVNGAVKYMVMDDLVVKPILSTISTVAFCLDMFKVKELGVLEEKVVDLGINQAFELLKASLWSKGSVLTTVFLKNMAK